MTKTFETEDEATNWAIQWLRERGLAVRRQEPEREMVSPGELRRRTGLKSATFHKRLHHGNCPPFALEFYPFSSRLKRVEARAELIEWLRAPLQPGRELC